MVALEHGVRLDVHLDVEIARRSAIDARLAFARKAHALALVDAGRDLDRKRLLQLDASRAAAGSAGIRDDAAAAMAERASLRDRDRTLRHPHLAGASAGRAGGGLRAGSSAAAFAALAHRHAGKTDLGFEAVRRLLQRDLEVVAQVGAAEHRGAAAGARAPAAEDLAEDIAEDVAEAAHARGAAGAHPDLRVNARVTELVVGRPLGAVAEDFVGLFRFLEVLLRLGMVRIAVRMPLHRKAAVSLLYFFIGSVAIDTENFVVVTLSQSISPFFCPSPR